MAGKVLKFTNGYPGAVTRSIDDIIESFANGEASDPILFGAPVALNAGKVVNVSATYNDVIGVAVRTVKTEETYGGNDPQYKAKDMVDVIKRGTVAMVVPAALTVAAGDPVFIVKATGALAKAADSTNTVATGWKFKGPKDDNNVVEVVLCERAF